MIFRLCVYIDICIQLINIFKMGGCQAEFCNNSSAKGYVMKRFPRNPQRRAEWAKNVNRGGWIPNDNSCLCEVHFAPEMWETKNKRKLKLNAVPTIFGFYVKQKVVPSSNHLESAEVSTAEMINEGELLCEGSQESSCRTPLAKTAMETVMISELITDQTAMKPKCISINISENEHESTEEFMPTDSEEIFETPLHLQNMSNLNLQRRILQLESTLQKRNLQLFRIRKKIKMCRNENLILKNRINKEDCRKALLDAFTEDQVKALITKKIPKMWSHDTLQRAFRLKMFCGNTGYEEIQRQNLPLPSLRTLRRVFEKANTQTEESNNVQDT